ncbi:branched-chain amino acid ABC transporter permease [Martelella sp. HB161492]|uniref:branched-chain amino acid ABC transporter permease n=1 Tax=Martelella sp. HB161492 TaxID=2720726 RepID=UPI00158FA02D|nr:branched-chain amino acid ABC transporter permease [Martelella sp. HB161492]
MMNRITYGALGVKIAALLIWAVLLFAPFLFQDVRALEVAARVLIFIALVASYDLLIGYTGIVSFAHTMFFGFGAYGVAIALKHYGPGWAEVALGALAGLVVSAIVAAAIGLLSLRVKAIFFAMITLAAGSVVLVLASQMSQFTGGEDGMTYAAPALFKPATKLLIDAHGKVVSLFGVKLNGKLAAYYFVFVFSGLVFAAMLRLVLSPLGTVLKAIRENEGRAEAIGYRVVAYRTFVFTISAVAASLIGSVYAVWLKYTGPDTTLSFAIMVDILLMVVIGGMGTMWGAVIGAALLVVAQFYLRDIMEAAATALAPIPPAAALMNPDRWLLWLGLLFILLVYFFPKGIAGTAMEKGKR